MYLIIILGLIFSLITSCVFFFILMALISLGVYTLLEKVLRRIFQEVSLFYSLFYSVSIYFILFLNIFKKKISPCFLLITIPIINNLNQEEICMAVGCIISCGVFTTIFIYNNVEFIQQHFFQYIVENPHFLEAVQPPVPVVENAVPGGGNVFGNVFGNIFGHI